MKRTPFFEAVVPATGIPWLEPQAAEVRLTAPPLPAALLLQAVAFFRAVYSRYAAEAVALLTWREATRTYELVVPHQTVGGGHCDYEVREFPAGLRRLGTIHSHAGIDAFHSWRDSEMNASKTASTSPSAIWTPSSPCRAPWSSRAPEAPSPRNASFPPSPSPGTRPSRSRIGPMK